MMKTSLLQVTLFCLVLPFLNTYFNFSTTFKFQPSATGAKYNTCLQHSNHSAHQCEFLGQNEDQNQQIAFGADLGKHYKSLNAIPNGYKIRRVVLDPGHGGKDTGCSSKNAREKTIALSIAKKLGAAIKYAYPDIEVIYTRSTDIFVPLHERAAIANRSKADLFISIHCNAMSSSSKGWDRVHGSETYVMGLSNASENLSVAKRENESILMEANYRTNYGGFDPNSPEGHIILSMYQNAYLEQSILFAEQVESNIRHFSKQKSRGVKQAGFVVLRETAMPSVLIESGYLTSAKDRVFLNEEQGQQTTAAAIMKAFRAYKEEIESVNTSYEIPVAVNPMPRTIPMPVSNSDLKSNSNQPAETQMYRQLMVKENLTQGTTKTSKNIPTDYQQIEKLQPSTTDNLPEIIQFKVQVYTANKIINTKEGPWAKVNYPIELRSEKDNIKYLVFGFKNLNEAIAAKQEMRAIGFKEAFVVAFKGNKRISVAEAVNEIKK